MIAAFSSDTEEVVLVTGSDGKPLRVTKADFDADQAKEKKDQTFKPWSGDEVAEQSQVGGGAAALTDGPPLAAPSAVDCSGAKNARKTSKGVMTGRRNALSSSSGCSGHEIRTNMSISGKLASLATFSLPMENT